MGGKLILPVFRSENLDKALSINALRLINFSNLWGANYIIAKLVLLAHADHKRVLLSGYTPIFSLLFSCFKEINPSTDSQDLLPNRLGPKVEDFRSYQASSVYGVGLFRLSS